MRHSPAFRLVGFLLLSGLAFAHHSSVMFDRDAEITMKATVKEFFFINWIGKIFVVLSEKMHFAIVNP